MIAALIRKDFIVHKAALLGFSLVMVCFLSWLASQGDSQNAFITIACLYSTILAVTLIGREDKFAAEAFVCSLPVTRRQVTRARYLTSWIVTLTCSLLGFVLYSLFGVEDAGAIWQVSSLGRMLLIQSAALGLLLPFLIRFGWQGLIFGLVGMQVFGILMFLIVRSLAPGVRLTDTFNIVSDFIDESQVQLGDALFILAALVALVSFNLASCRVAEVLFDRKEL